MPRHRQIPAYVHHKPSGQARVRINGKDFYLGKFGSSESHDRYDELIGAHVIGTDLLPTKTLTAVLAAWWLECKRRYRKGKGKLGGAQNWRPVIRMLRTACGSETADRLGPAKLREDQRQAGLEKARRAAAKAHGEAFEAEYADLVPVIEELREAGDSLQAIADELNGQGHTTRRGKPWNRMQVSRVLERSA